MISLVEVFSISIDLDKQKFVALSCSVDAAGTLQASGTGTSYSSQERPSFEFIDPENNDGVNLCGTVVAIDGFGREYLLYNIDPKDAVFVCSKDTISLKGPSNCMSPWRFEVYFDLKDKDTELHISKGWFNYDAHEPTAYFKKRLSSVVHGDNGCAIMHYMLFPSAREAVVEAKLYTHGDNRSSASLVFGSVVVGYGGHDYSNEYQKKYYRTALFRQAMHGAVQLNGNSADLPLSRSMIVAPKDTTIIIEADLYEKNGETRIALVNNSVEFPFQVGGTASREILGENVRMVVNIHWRTSFELRE